MPPCLSSSEESIFTAWSGTLSKTIFCRTSRRRPSCKGVILQRLPPSIMSLFLLEREALLLHASYSTCLRRYSKCLPPFYPMWNNPALLQIRGSLRMGLLSSGCAKHDTWEAWVAGWAFTWFWGWAIGRHHYTCQSFNDKNLSLVILLSSKIPILA